MMRLVFLALVSVICANPVKDLAGDLENWMGKLPDELKEVSLNNLAIPGSHDSFTVDINHQSEVSPDGAEILKALEKLPLIKTVIANWSKTQSFNVVEQLKAGIRFFDLRICHNSTDGVLYFCHSMYSTEVSSVLQMMRQFLAEHPEEVVILDCQHFFNFTTNTHEDFIAFLQENFGEMLIPVQGSMSEVTLKNLKAKKQQVFVIYRHSSQTSNSKLWPSTMYPTPWYDTMNQTYLISNLNNGLKNRPSNTGYISQLVLTASAQDIVAKFLSSLKRECAENFEEKRSTWISEQKPGKHGVNVIIADYVELSDGTFSKMVINLNLNMEGEGVWESVKEYLSGVYASWFGRR